VQKVPVFGFLLGAPTHATNLSAANFSAAAFYSSVNGPATAPF